MKKPVDERLQAPDGPGTRIFGTLGQLFKPDEMRMPVSGGMLYAPKLSTRLKRKRYKETGNEEG